ncbi:MAG: hypothetical protein WCW56_03540 [Candidatus Paceibacterota bacterium]
MSFMTKKRSALFNLILIFCLFVAGVFFVFGWSQLTSFEYKSEEVLAKEKTLAQADKSIILPKPEPLKLDKLAYDQKMIELANYPKSSSTATTSVKSATTTVKAKLWPPKSAYPNGGALLPFNRIIAYYGNFYSKNMGILGELPPEQMLAKLDLEVKKWQLADPKTPVIPAIHYIAVTAQGSAGADGKYRLRMPKEQIDKAIVLAKKNNGIVFLDIQVGLSTLQSEIPALEPYLKLPQVHLGIDPEFSMKTGAKPGTVIGTFSATDINFATNYLAKIVRDNNLPPKILIIHRFTQPMLTSYRQIVTVPEVQIVINMDGWGPPAQKVGTYNNFIVPEPVQFTGFKIFYKNDLRPANSRLLSPTDLLKLKPRPIYIQYQ